MSEIGWGKILHEEKVSHIWNFIRWSKSANLQFIPIKHLMDPKIDFFKSPITKNLQSKHPYNQMSSLPWSILEETKSLYFKTCFSHHAIWVCQALCLLSLQFLKDPKTKNLSKQKKVSPVSGRETSGKLISNNRMNLKNLQ